MKKTRIILILIIFLSVLYFSCPILNEEESAIITLSYESELTYSEWIEILYEIFELNRFVNLDLTDCTPAGDYVEFSDAVFFDFNNYLVFNPLPHLTDSGFSGLNEIEKEKVKIAKENIVSIILPESATGIIGGMSRHFSAFKDFKYLQSVTGEKINFVGPYGFFGLNRLREINFPLLKNIGDFAFAECSALNRVKFPLVTIIGNSAFENSALIKIDEEDLSDAQIIMDAAFRGCNILESVILDSASKIGNEAFANCAKLKHAVFNVDIPTPSSVEFPILNTLEVHDNSLIFYERVFVGSRSLEKLEVSYAWNVYFSKDALANIGTDLTIRIFDHHSNYEGARKIFGHPQLEDFLGHRMGGNASHPRTINSITFIIPNYPEENTSQIMTFPDKEINGITVSSIYNDIINRYGDGAVEISFER